MANKKDPLPENMTIEDASKFWDTHSIADYDSQVVRLEYKPEGRTTFVAIADDLLRRLEKEAKRRGVSVETLVNLWIQERLAS